MLSAGKTVHHLTAVVYVRISDKVSDCIFFFELSSIRQNIVFYASYCTKHAMIIINEAIVFLLAEKNRQRWDNGLFISLVPKAL